MEYEAIIYEKHGAVAKVITNRPRYKNAQSRLMIEEMDRAFGSTFGLTRSMGQRGIWSPAVEVREHDNQIEITAELPGLNKEDVKLEIANDQIVLEGEKKNEEEKDIR